MIKFLSLISGTMVFAFSGVSNTIQLKESLAVTLTDEEASEFLYDRTFSVRAPSSGGNYYGTGWLLKHIDGYKYYLMTNWHVSDVMPQNLSFSFAPVNNLHEHVSSYSMLNQGLVDWNPASYYQEDDKLLGADASLLEVNFGTPSSQPLKDRLDALNDYSDSHDGYMFNGFKNYNAINAHDDFYVGGYPLEDWSDRSYGSPQWEWGTDEVSGKANNFSKKSTNHPINENKKIFSISNGYYTSQNSFGTGPLFKLGGGASGSAMIDSDGNLMGLYWGGRGNTYIYQCEFEAFEWGNHDLFNDYLNNMWISTKITKNWWGLISVGIVCVCVVGIGTTIYYVRKSKTKKKN